MLNNANINITFQKGPALLVSGKFLTFYLLITNGKSL